MSIEAYLRHGETKELVIGDKIFKSANDFELIEKDLEKANKDLGETAELKKKCLIQLKEKLSKKEKINYCTDEAYLLRFLRVRKYDVERAYQNIKIFYDVKKKIPGCFAIPSDVKSVQSLNVVTYLPYCDEDGRIVFWVNIGRWNIEVHSYEEIMQCAMGICDIVTMDPKSQINGVIGVWDFSGFSMSHFTELLKNNRLWSTVTTFQNGYPYRIHKLIVVNTGRVTQMLFSIIRPLLSRKISQRIFLIGSDMTELHQHVNPAILPKTLGGALDEEECTRTQHVIDNLPYLQYERSFT